MAIDDKILIDTSVFFALSSSSDVFHNAARSGYERLVDWEWELWTTSNVLVETIALTHHRLGYESVEALMGFAMSRLIHILWVERSIHDDAWKRMVEHRGRGLSYVDWTTVVASERLKATVFTFDKGFSQEGVPVFPSGK